MQTHCRPDLIPDTWLCQSSSSLAWHPRGKTLVNISHLALQTESSQYPFELWLWTTVHYQCVSLPVCQKIRGWESEVSNWCTETEIQICVAVPGLPREQLIGLGFLCSSPTWKHLKTPLQHHLQGGLPKSGGRTASRKWRNRVCVTNWRDPARPFGNAH